MPFSQYLRMIMGTTLMLVSFIAKSEQPFLIEQEVIKERKFVFATIEPIDMTQARTRSTGTIDGLSIEEGDLITRGDVVAVVVDEKQPLEISAVDAQLNALKAQLELAKIELERIKSLISKGVASKAQLDEIVAKNIVLENDIKALKADRLVLIERLAESQIKSPATGRVLKVLQTNGSVVQPGETIAIIGIEQYILRITLPERHAQALQQGEFAQVYMNNKMIDSKILKIYPLIENGVVTADLAVDHIGNYFVGQRVEVSIPTIEKTKILIPESYLHHRYGLSFVTLEDGHEIVVQPGAKYNGKTEILSGLQAGDKIITP